MNMVVTKVANLRPNPNPIDPDVVVPAAVRRAAEAATAAQAAAYPDGAPPTPAEANTSPANNDTITIAEPVVLPPPTVQPTAPVTPVGNEAPVEPPVSEQTWEHRARSAEGRYVKAEKLSGQLAERITALEGIIQDLNSTPRPAAAPVVAPTAPVRFVTEQEENEFGTEMLDVVGRRAREIVSPELAELRTQMAAMEQKLLGTNATVKKTAQQEMLSQLDSKLPEWREVNKYNEFKAWLALPDPYSGAKRHDMLLSAFDQNDTVRVLNFFNGFISELAASTPANELPLSVPPAAVQPTKPGLEALAAPGRARTPAAQTPPAEKRIITSADVSAFYNAKRRGDYRGREAEFDALEQELFKAQREGRVQAV
jgi:hypothetical protein